LNLDRVERQLTGSTDNTFRNRARRDIIAAANRNSDRKFTMKNLQQAVNVCRRQHLVSGNILATAGFNPTGRKR